MSKMFVISSCFFLGTRNTETNVFPQDKVVLAGSNMTICCMSPTKVLSGQIGNTFRPLIHLYGETVAIHILNIPVSENSGTNIIFSTDDDVYGTVIFAGCKHIVWNSSPQPVLVPFQP